MRAVAVGAVTAAALSAAKPALAQTATLFTTQDDFSGWTVSGNTVSVSPSNTYDFDGSTTNGYGNTTSPNSAASMGAGSLQINTGSSAIGFETLTSSPDEHSNQSFMGLIDPGSVGGATVADTSGTLYFTYTAPSFVGPNVYDGFGVDFSYPGDSYYHVFSVTNTLSDGKVDGMTTYTATVPYTITAGASGGFHLLLNINAGVYGSGVAGTSNVMTAPFYLDDLVVTGTPPVTFSAATASWVTNGSSAWETAANWSSSPAIPGAAGSRITFDNDGGAITANPTVTLSNAVTATLLTFGNTSGTAVNYTIASGAPGASITVSAEIDVNSGSHAINVPVAAGGNFVFGIAPGASLTIPSLNAGSGGTITVTGPGDAAPGGGTLTLGSSGSYNLNDNGTNIIFNTGSTGFLYGLNVNTGSIVNLGANTWNTNSIASDGTGTIIIPTGGALYTGEYTAGTVTYSGAFSGGGSIVVGEGGSTSTTATTLFLYGNNSAFTGTITAGSTTAAGAFTLAVGSANSLGGGSVILDGGILQAIGSFATPGTQNVLVTANGGTIDTDGPSSSPITGGCSITVGAVTSAISGATLAKINPGKVAVTSINGVALSIAGGTSQYASTVQILPNNGTLAGAHAGVSVLTSLNIETSSGNYTSSLDLTNNSLIVQSSLTPSTAESVFGTPITANSISNEVASGRGAGGNWAGTGITSSTAATVAAGSAKNTALAVVINDTNQTGAGSLSGTQLISTFEGQNVSDGDILVKYTYYGDALLTGSVTAADYTQIDNGFNLHLTGWYNGDFNYDGVVNGDDYTLIDNAYNTQGSATFLSTSSEPAEMIASSSAQVSAVPEPASLSLIALSGLLMSRRRNRR